MASQQSQRNQQTDRHLSPDQQDLLLAALNSQANGRQQTYPQTGNSGVIKRSPSDPLSRPRIMNSINDAGLFMSPHEADLEHFNGDYTPDLDYLDDDDNFDFENADLGGEMIGALPDHGDGPEQHEKRKNPDEGDESEEGDAKRQETQEGEKGAKKPGRKPLTSEPTTKRKAQNRAAQRAFRERKEKHLKDLETKVSQLTKAQEADKHENSLLKAQNERLSVELREYRKRLSLNGISGAKRSPPPSATGNRGSNYSSNYGNNFQFDFPKFGGLPGSQIFGNQTFSNGSNTSLVQGDNVTPPAATSPITNGSFNGSSMPNENSRENSLGRTSMSPRSLSLSNNSGSPSQSANLNPSFTGPPIAAYSTNDNMHGFASTLPQMTNATNDPFGDLFSPSILKSASIDSTNNYFNDNTQVNGNNLSDFKGGDSTAGLNRVFQFNSSSSVASDSASPSGSSAGQWNGNANSSNATSPEPSHDSPANKAINTMRNQSPLANNLTSMNNTQFTNGLYSLPSVDAFDPTLFGDYRDSQDAIVGGGDFTGGFFDEALNPAAPFDYPSPSNLFGILQSPQQTNTTLSVPSSAMNAPTPSQSLMAEMEKTQNGGDDDYGLFPEMKQSKPEDKAKMISCNNIWSQLQSNPDYQEGKFDLDSLCSELRTKARCSESGVVVDQDHVDSALRRLGKKDEQGKVFEGPPHLMFEQDSWDKVLKKLEKAT